MNRIEKDQWLNGLFAVCTKFQDVLRQPDGEYKKLAGEEKDKLRQTQIERGEMIRVLGYEEDESKFALIMKWDGVLGWLSVDSFRIDEGIKKLEAPRFPKISEIDFLKKWAGVSYVWGGTTHAGVDCSGLTQRYYLEVFGKVIPRNCRNQRSFGKSKSLKEIKNSDLVFCFRKGRTQIHHVGVFLDGLVWHAQSEKGVISVPLNEFAELYQIEDVASIPVAK